MSKEKLQESYNKINQKSIFGTTGVSYVPTHLQDLKKNFPHSQPQDIELADILKYLESPSSKILIDGNSGTGKSTLTNQLLLLWAQGKLDNFDYVFKIKWKSFKEGDWKNYGQEEALSNPVASFIFYSLYELIDRKSIPKNKKVTLQDIKEIIEDSNNKILLIADEYSDIAIFDNNRDRKTKEFIDEIFDSFKHIVMTTKPDVMSIARENSFDKKIQVLGFSNSGIEQFVDNYFNQEKKQLEEIVRNFFGSKTGATHEDLENYLKLSSKDNEQEALIQLKRILYFNAHQSPLSSDSFDRSPISNLGKLLNSINFYYKNTIDAVKDTLKNNPSIRDIASYPMNLELLCLTFSDPEIHQNFSSSSTIYEIYQSFLILLGKKYVIQNFDMNHEEFNNINNLLELPEFLALREVAYKLLFNNNIITGSEIDTIAKSFGKDFLTLSTTGLLRNADNHNNFTPQNSERIPLENNPSIASYSGFSASGLNISGINNFLTKKYSFIHPSIQEFLAASAIKNKLLSNESNDYMQAVKFIAEHRNEPQHRMLLKFVAGLLSDLPESKEANLAITRFWEAIECIIEEQLEIGSDQKVTLFMDLLPQTQKGNYFDPRIPNLEKVTLFVDNFISGKRGIIKWGEKIKSSGFLSVKLEEHLWKVLEISVNTDKHILTTFSADSLLNSHQDLNSLIIENSESKDEGDNAHSPKYSVVDKEYAVSIASFMFKKLDNPRLINALANNIKPEGNEWDLIKISIKLVTEIMNFQGQNIPTNPLFIYISKLFDLLNHSDLREHVIPAIHLFSDTYINEDMYISAVIDNLMLVIKKGIQDQNLNDLISKLLLKTNPEILSNSLNKLIDIIITVEDPIISEDLLSPIIDELTILPRTRRDTTGEISNQSSAAQEIAGYLIESLIKSDENIAALIVQKLIAKISQQESEGHVDNTIGKILLISSAEIQENIFKNVMNSLHNDSLKKGVIDAINAIVDPSKKIPNHFAEAILIELTHILVNENSIPDNDVTQAIINIAKSADNIGNNVKEELYNSLIGRKIDHNILLALSYIIPSNSSEKFLKIFTNILSLLQTFESDQILLNALTQLTLSDLDQNSALNFLAQFDPLQNFNLLAAIPIANVISKFSNISPSTLENYVNKLVYTIDNKTYVNNLEALRIIAKNHKIHDLIEKLLHHIQSNQNILGDTMISIMKLIVDLPGIFNYHSPEQIRNILSIIINNENTDLKLLSQIINKLHKIFPNTISTLINKDIITFLDGDNSNKIQLAISVLTKISIESIETKESLLERMITYLGNQDYSLKAARIIINTMSNDNSGTLTKNIIDDSLIPIVRQAKYNLNEQSNYAAYIISKFISKIDIKDDKLLKFILLNLKPIADKYEKRTDIIDPIKDSMIKIIESMSLSTSIKLFYIKCPIICKIATKVITQKIINKEFETSWNKDIENMLTIIGNNIESLDPESVKLHDTARKYLYDSIKSIDEGKLKWITQNFDKLLNISRVEAEKMMKILFDSVFFDHEVTNIERQFMEKCITTLGLTITISVEKTPSEETIVKIQYQGTTYTLTGEDNKKNIEQLVNNLKNLITKEVLFENSGSALPSASIEIKNVPSIIDGTNLNDGSAKISFMYLSDNARSDIKDFFIYIEERNIHGYYKGTKIYLDNSNNIQVTSSIQRPTSLNDPIFRKQIFGDISEDVAPYRSRFYAKTLDIPLGDANNLKNAMQREYTPNTVDIRKSYKPAPKYYNPWRIEDLSLTRPQYKKALQEDNSKSNFYDTLKNFWDLLLTQKGEPLQNLSELGILKDWSKISFDNFIELRPSDQLLLIDITRQGSTNGIIKTLLSDRDLSQKAKSEKDKIYKDDYKRAFYEEIIKSLTAIYGAAKVINTEMVKNQQKGVVGHVGNIVDFLSDNLLPPGIKVGGKLLAEIFKSVDDVIESGKIKNLANFSLTDHEMTEMSEMIARKLAFTATKLKSDDLQLSDLIVTFNQILQDGVVDTAVQTVASTILTQESDKLSSNAQEGMEDGARVARYIVEKISSGEYKNNRKSYVGKKPPIVNDIVQDVKSNLYQSLEESSSKHPKTSETVDKPPCCIIMNVACDIKNPQELFDKKENPLFTRDIKLSDQETSLIQSFDFAPSTVLKYQRISEVNNYFNRPEVKNLFLSLNEEKINQIMPEKLTIKVIYTHKIDKTHYYIKEYKKATKYSDNSMAAYIQKSMEEFSKMFPFNPLQTIPLLEDIPLYQDDNNVEREIVLISDDRGFRIATELEQAIASQRMHLTDSLYQDQFATLYLDGHKFFSSNTWF